MSLFRRSTPVEDVMRLALQAAISRDYDQALSEVVAGGILSPDDVAALKLGAKIEIALWQVCFMYEASAQGAPIAPYEIGRRFGMALALAAVDVRGDKERALAEAELRIDQCGPYCEACDGGSLPRPPSTTAPLRWLEHSRGACRLTSTSRCRATTVAPRISIGRDAFGRLKPRSPSLPGTGHYSYT